MSDLTGHCSISSKLQRTSLYSHAADNPDSERDLYPILFDQGTPASRKQGATFSLTDFRVVLASNETVPVNFTYLVAGGSKRNFVVLGNVRVLEEPGKKDVSEEEEEEDDDGDNAEDSDPAPRRKGATQRGDGPKTGKASIVGSERTAQPFVRLIGGVDFRSVTINSAGFQLESRYSTYHFQEPQIKYKVSTLLDAAVDLVNLWSLARWESVGGVTSEEELADEVRKKLEFWQGRKKQRPKAPIEWQRKLPKWCQVDILKVTIEDDVAPLLHLTLPDPPL